MRNDSVDYYIEQYKSTRDTSIALSNLSKALKYAESYGGSNQLFKAHLAFGEYYMINGDIGKSLQHLEQFDSVTILSQANKIKHKYFIVIGQNYYHQGNYDLAGEMYVKSLLFWSAN